MKSRLFFILIVAALSACEKSAPQQSNTAEKIDSLLSVMTLEEKAGQLNFLVGDLFNTGPTVRTSESDKFDELIRQGKITGLFNIHGAAYTARLQKIAVEESRLKIPLVFGADIIHGFKTVTPLSLAEAASWDMDAIEASSRVAAEESTSTGISFTFAPMVDISRDARWGRISEGAGEDPYLGAAIARARVMGFQGHDLSAPNTMAACIKHFAAYGAPVAGLDYNTVDLSEQLLREIYLPPYKAGIDAGAATVMTAFNELNGIPATGHSKLLTEILRNEFGFEGMVVSDWQSVGEMLIHGYAQDSTDAALKAISAGTDVDMMSEIYIKHLPQLVTSGKIEMSVVDEAVRRVLELKFKLGLFDDPYRYSDTLREKSIIRSTKNLEVARDVARKSIVLLKNKNNLLPFRKDLKKVAVIGPLANNAEEMNGSWAFFGEPNHPVTLLEGLKKAMPQTNFTYASGCNLFDSKTDGFNEALKLAQQSELVIIGIGETSVMHGEGSSRSDIGLPFVQQQLVEALHRTGKPIVVVLMNGRPLAIPWIDEHIPAIVEAWNLGSEAGHAIADVLTGAYNPSGKLPVTFPRNVGQVPIFYNHKNTGRPYRGDYTEPESARVYASRYRDTKNTPLYPFGYGLSYSTFTYDSLYLNKKNIAAVDDSLQVSVVVTNHGPYDGEEVVQLYIRDMVGSVTRPVKELKGFKKVFLKVNESMTLNFTLHPSSLSFYRSDGAWGVEPGTFKVFVGGNSVDNLETEFTLVE